MQSLAPIPAPRILPPLQRLFEPVLGRDQLQTALAKHFEAQWGANAVPIVLFSDFPTIDWDVGVQNRLEHWA